MQGDTGKKGTRLSRLQKIGLTLTGLFLIYVIVGFWVLPPLLTTQLTQRLSDLTGRQVTIEAVKLNPLVLSATTSNLTVHETDGAPFAGFAELYVNVQLSSLFRWAGTVKEIRLTSPFAVLHLMPGGKLNIDDIVARFIHSASQTTPDRGLPRAIMERLEVLDGTFTVENSAFSEPVKDVVTPITFTLENLSTLKGREGEFQLSGVGPIGGDFDLTGNLGLNPLNIQGRLVTEGTQLRHYWDHIKDLVSFEIIKGTIGVSVDFFAAIDDAGLSARLENGTVRLDDFELKEKGQKAVLIALPRFSTTGVHVDLKSRAITVDAIRMADARFQSWLSADGTFTHQEMVLKDLQRLTEAIPAKQTTSQTPPATPWQVTLQKLELSDWKLAFEDRTLSRPASLSADALNAVVQNLSTQKDTQATLGLSMRVNQGGQFQVDGTAGIDPLQADMTVATTAISLKPFQPYVDVAVNAQVIGGSISSRGRIRYRGKDARPQIRVDGDFSVDQLQIQDRVQTDDFITLAKFKASDLSLELRPNSLRVPDVLFQRPHARVTIDKAGVINVVNVFSPDQEENASDKKNLFQRLVKFLILQFKGPMPLQVDRTRIERVTADFIDASIAPPFDTHVEITEATVTGLSSEPSDTADIKLTGSIDQTTLFEASGQMNPMNALQYSKVDLTLKDYGLESVSPYAGKYLGYRIAKGALQTDLNYKIEQDQVHGDNIITIDGLELGEAVDSPDALNLPIKLGVTLLKDKNGRITLRVPVVGNVQDPQFDFAKSITSALTGSITKSGSEPFAAIGKIDGFAGEELGVIDFDAGLSALPEREARKLDALAIYLKQKTALNLGILGTADRQMDGAAVMGHPHSQAPHGDTAQRNPKATAQAVDETIVDEKRLKALAQRRAKRVSAYLVEQAGIDGARIQIKPVQIKPQPDGGMGRVKFSLSVK